MQKPMTPHEKAEQEAQEAEQKKIETAAAAEAGKKAREKGENAVGVAKTDEDGNVQTGVVKIETKFGGPPPKKGN